MPASAAVYLKTVCGRASAVLKPSSPPSPASLPTPPVNSPPKSPCPPARRMSYRPSAPRLIPSHRRTHECSPASLGRRVNSRLSRDGSDSGHSQGWNSPRPRSSASRSSGGHSSDLIFPMDSEPGSDSSSSRQGSVEPDFLYETPRGNQAVWNPAAMPVCSRCGRLYHGHVPPPGLDRAVAICPSCSLRESRERVEQRAPDDDFYNTTGYHLYRGRAIERYIPSHVPQQQGYDPRTRRQRVNSMYPRLYPCCDVFMLHRYGHTCHRASIPVLCHSRLYSTIPSAMPSVSLGYFSTSCHARGRLLSFSVSAPPSHLTGTTAQSTCQ